jgi:hypothetical protein
MPGVTKKFSHQLPFCPLKLLNTESLILIGIFLLAIVLRMHIDPTIPFHYDPGKNIVYTRAVLEWFPLFPQSNQYFNLGEYYEYQVLFPYISAFFYKISALPLTFIVTWVAILSGAALTLMVYYFTKELFDDNIAALISAFLIAVSKVQLFQYMNYYPQILATTLVPLSLLFLVRYIRSHTWNNLVLVAILSSLIILASYLVALVYFTILLLSLVIWSFFERKTLKTLILIPGSTILLLTFFWLPIVWRHGPHNVMKTVGVIIFTPTSLFTNQPMTLSTFLTYSSGAVIAIIAVICMFFISRKIHWDFPKILLSTWVCISFLFMASYLFYPILWVDRYSPFLDIAVIICAGGALQVIITFINKIKTGPGYKGYLILLLLIVPLYGGIYSDVVFFSWGYPSDFAMLEYMEQNIPANSLVVAPAGIQGYWVSALSGTRILGGDPSQMLGHIYNGEEDSSTIINSANLDKKLELIRKYGVNYIYLPLHEPVSSVWNPRYFIAGVTAFSNGTYFEQVNSIDDAWGRTLLLRVRENLQPRYNQLPVNWPVTAVGYLVSVLSIIGLMNLRNLSQVISGYLP